MLTEEASFGALLRRHRLATGLSQEMLAERSRLSVEAISALERGVRRAPQRETLNLLAAGLCLAPIARREFEAAAAAARPPGKPRTRIETVTGETFAPATNLPYEVTSFVGREAEIAELTALVQRNRLVTIAGAGGVGKTRTAIRVARTLLGDFRDGVRFVELAALPSAYHITGTIAATLALAERGESAPLEPILELLRTRQMLLVLDNCEHLITQVAKIAEAILQYAPEVKIIATSREALKVAGEHEYRITSLTAPPAGLSLSAAGAMGYGAIRLFVERARETDRHFTLAEETVAVVADICRRLDGMPLAIELAAARVKVLALAHLAQRLTERFRVLSGGNRTALPRQQTMRAAIDWSYDLLSDRERKLFARLGIFVGGWTLEAAEAVCAGAIPDVLETLTSLVEKSLVAADACGHAFRYRFLETTRDYAFDRLEESGERPAMERELANWAVAFSERICQAYLTKPTKVWIADVQVEIGNVRAALGWALEHDPVAAAQIAGNTTGLWARGGLRMEGRSYIELALSKIDQTGHPLVAARLYRTFANLSIAKQRVDSATRAIELLQSGADLQELGRAYDECAFGLIQMGRTEEARAMIDRALATYRKAKLDRSRSYGISLNAKAIVLADLGDIEGARDGFAQTIDLFDLCGDDVGVATAKYNLAELEFSRGNVQLALDLAYDSMAMFIRDGDPDTEGQTLRNIAAYHLVLGELEEAKACARRGLTLSRAVQEPHLYIWIQHLAAIAALHGSSRAAARLLGYVDERYARDEYRREPTEQKVHDITVEALTALLEPADLERLTAVGSRLSDEEAADLALHT